MNNSRSPHGREGNLEHQEVLRLIRTKVMPILYKRGFPYAGILTFETPWAYKLHYSKIKEKGNEYPDSIICSRYIPQEINTPQDIGKFVIIEIGNYNPSKWPNYPVLHIDKKSRHVSTNRFIDNAFEFEVVKTVQEALDADFSYSLDNLPLDELRRLAVLSMVGSGITSGEMEHIQWKDIDLNNGIINVHDERDDQTLYTLQIELPPFLRSIIEQYKQSIIETGIGISDLNYFAVNLREIKKSGSLNGIKRRAIEKDIAKLFGFNNDKEQMA